MMLKGDRRLWLAVGVAAVWWFYMFSPWTAGVTNFWFTMTAAALCLTAFALSGTKASSILNAQCSILHCLRQLLLGVLIAAVLWGVFWLGDRISSVLFDFARPQVDSIYGMKTGLPPWLIAVLLLLVIGPAEELFWRGYVQRVLSARRGRDWAFVVTTAVYALIHVWSFNFMLVMAALVCGLVWGLLYRFKPSWLPAIIVSHALWDACVFVVFPI